MDPAARGARTPTRAPGGARPGTAAIGKTRQEAEVIVGLDVGFGYTKTVTGAGVDVSPSVVGEWMPGAFRLGVELGDAALAAH